ncbi:MAG: hypothetical protein NTV30_09995, partial [Chloroflexi bacterium]|nr:hypothetical protein [Chloroflexota bacterium]
KLDNISAYIRLYFRRPQLLRNAIPLLCLVAVAVGGLTYGVYQRITRPTYVYTEEGRVVGAKGNPIILKNNRHAENPTWEELKQFLLEDNTDKILYEDAIFVCSDFSETLHNNAEKAGIKAGYVCITFFNSTTGHTLNVFTTTDRGIIYIDDTGTETGILNADKTVDCAKDAYYQPVSIFPNPGYFLMWENMGTVKEIWVQW